MSTLSVRNIQGIANYGNEIVIPPTSTLNCQGSFIASNFALTSVSTDSITNVAGTQAINIDASGTVTFPQLPVFAVRGSNISRSTGTYDFNTGAEQTDNRNNLVNNRFTAPVNGWYFFAANVRFDSVDVTYHRLHITKNGGGLDYQWPHVIRNWGNNAQSYDSLTLSGVMRLNTGDYIELKLYSNGDTSWNDQGESTFSGFLIG